MEYHILTEEQCKDFKGDQFFQKTLLVYSKGKVVFRKGCNDPDMIPAPMFSEIFEAIERKHRKSFYYYCWDEGIAFPKNIENIYEIYKGNKYWWCKK